jgi:hypothetical protein
MSSAKIPIENRVVFLDNLRFFIVLCVVLQHSSNAYTNLTWWPVSDDASSVIVGFTGNYKKGRRNFSEGKAKKAWNPLGDLHFGDLPYFAVSLSLYT